jgi:hypothetical protein
MDKCSGADGHPVSPAVTLAIDKLFKACSLRRMSKKMLQVPKHIATAYHGLSAAAASDAMSSATLGVPALEPRHCTERRINVARRLSLAASHGSAANTDMLSEGSTIDTVLAVLDGCETGMSKSVSSDLDICQEVLSKRTGVSAAGSHVPDNDTDDSAAKAQCRQLFLRELREQCHIADVDSACSSTHISMTGTPKVPRGYDPLRPPRGRVDSVAASASSRPCDLVSRLLKGQARRSTKSSPDDARCSVGAVSPASAPGWKPANCVSARTLSLNR